MTSNVGSSGVYEAGDQRNYKDSEIRDAKKEERFEEGKENSHVANDSKDERSIANRLASAEKNNKKDDEDDGKTLETKLLQEDPTLPALMHGNEPSKGAKIDKQIVDEEAEIIAKMDAKKEAKNASKK